MGRVYQLATNEVMADPIGRVHLSECEAGRQIQSLLDFHAESTPEIPRRIEYATLRGKLAGEPIQPILPKTRCVIVEVVLQRTPVAESIMDGE